MSIADAIINAQNKVKAVYTKCEEKGATLPGTQDLANLPATIDSIPTGSGGGSEVEAKAFGTELYSKGDKVILTPTTIISADNVLYNYDSSAFPMWYEPTRISSLLNYEKAYLYFNSWNAGYNHERLLTLTWNATRDAITGATSSPGATFYYVEYRDPVKLAAYKNGNDYSIGIMNDSTFISSGVLANVIAHNVSKPFTYINKHFVCYDASKRGVVNDDGSITWYNNGRLSSGAFAVPSYYNGNWYIIHSGSVYPFMGDDTAASFSYSGATGMDVYHAVDDEGTYFICGATMYKIIKNNTAWSRQELSAPTITLGKAFIDTTTRNVICKCKDFGDYVDIYGSSGTFGYAQGEGSRVAHFKFYKSTETLERLADIFLDVEDKDGYMMTDLQVNWDLGLISLGILNYNHDASYPYAYIKKINYDAGIYKYYAYKSEKSNYFDKSITGFVKENLGANEYGDVTLKVKATEDTNYEWSNIGKVFGFDIISSHEGELE